VRELKNAMERAVVLASGDTITDKDMPQIGAAAEPRGDSEGNMSLKMAEERQIRRVLRLTDWNKSHAAKMLGISRSRLDRKLKDYGITRGSTYRDE
jgi:DNA-binding NtrC family response regulator